MNIALYLRVSTDKQETENQALQLFATQPPQLDLHIEGIQRQRTDGRQIIVLASRNSEVLAERAKTMGAVSVDVAPITLREVFLETVQE